MASMLEGALARVVARGLQGKLLRGVLRRVGSATVDQFGDPVPGAAVTYSFEGIRESFDARYREQAGIPETDVAVLVLLRSVKPLTEPAQGDQVRINGRWHQVRRILDVDPAGASMRLQCYEIADPT